MIYDDYMLWLFSIKNMWQKKIETLLTYFQTPENIYKASETILEKSNCIKAKDIAEIMESRNTFDIQKETFPVPEREVPVPFFQQGSSSLSHRYLILS